MKIERVETFLVTRFLVVRVTTDDGIVGIGESCYWSHPKAAEQTVLALGEAIRGMDPGDTEHLWNYMSRYNGSFRSNSIGGAVSAIDMALWDIKGKRLQAPVWDLLGGKVRQRVRALGLGIRGDTPEEQAASAKKAVEGGYTAVKFTPMPREWQLQRYPMMIKDAVARVEAVREAVGWEVDIGLEIHRNMQPAEALVFCDEVAKFRPYFIEDPLVPESVVAMGDLAAKMRLPLAVGERNQGPYEFREYAQLTGCAFFKPDVAVAGGITGLRKISAIAEANHVRIAPHNFQGPIATAACVQLGVAMPAWDVQEVADETTGARRAMVKRPVPIRDGYFLPPESPGLGVEFVEAAAKKYPYEAPKIPPEIREDGAVALR